MKRIIFLALFLVGCSEASESPEQFSNLPAGDYRMSLPLVLTVADGVNACGGTKGRSWPGSPHRVCIQWGQRDELEVFGHEMMHIVFAELGKEQPRGH